MFFEIFSGPAYILTSAVVELGCCALFPLDNHKDHGGDLHDILNNETFEWLLRICASGFIALIHSSPPCGPFSALREIPGGPP